MKLSTKPKALVKCGKQSLVGVSSNYAHYVHRIYCHRWDCPVCGKYKKAQLSGKMHHAQVRNQFYLIFDGGWENMNHAISSFLRRLRYRYEGLQYLLLIKHADNRGEIIFFTSNIQVTRGKVAGCWQDAGGSYVKSEMPHFDANSVIHEASEFLRCMEPLEKHSRLMRSSQGFFEEIPAASQVLPELSEWEWHWDPRPPESIASDLESRKFKVDWLNEDAFIALPI